ncbi:glycosyltransferase family 2 protein [Labrys okinawensis]|uniref:glycosyltransferase family 2 protein n=1 Tax=Labrys okinawensis TaxID=346911 RepID=UPI0015E3A562|nr:glycosyltransferase family 2 protein [Labrys okinawensis]
MAERLAGAAPFLGHGHDRARGAGLMLLVIDAIGLVAGLFLVVLLGQHLRLAWRARRYRTPPMRQHAEPVPILLQIPLYNEAGSVEGALASALALDWPADRLTIQLLDDSTDETAALAAAAIARLPPGGPAVQQVRRPSRDGFKAGALAEGMRRCDAPLIAILDADFRAPSDWLRQAAAVLAADRRAAFVQFRFEFGNRDQNWMTSGQQFSVDTHFLAEQAGRQAGGDMFQFNGTGAVWRRAAIEAAGGWSADTLAEDLDLTLRTYAAGWHGQLVLEAPLSCEAPADLASWRVQQARWSTGFVQVARKGLPLVWGSKWTLGAKFGTSLLLGLQLGLPCLVLAAGAFVLDGLLRGFGSGHALLAAAAALYAATSAILITLPPFLRLRRGGIFRYGATLIAIPVLLIFLALANSVGVIAAPFAGRHDFVRTPKRGDR